MTDYGIVPTGFNRKTADIIRSERVSLYQGVFGDDIKTESTSAFGNLIDSETEREALLWELLENIYLSSYPDTADDTALDHAVSLVGVGRLLAEYSTATLYLATTGASPVVVPAFSQSKQSATNTVWETTTDTTIPAAVTAHTGLEVTNITWQSGTTVRYTFSGTPDFSAVVAGDLIKISGAGTSSNNGVFLITTVNDGSDYIQVSNPARTSGTGDETGSDATADITDGFITASARSVIKGLFVAGTQTINTIVNPISGWDFVGNIAAAAAGRDLETDSALRLRKATALVVSRGGVLASIINRISTEVDGVTYVSGRENRTNAVDGNGLPAHSFEITVVGGTDADIAQMIWDAKPAGIETYGTEDYTITDDYDESQIMYFSRVTELPIFLIVNLTTNGSYPATGDADVQEALVLYGAGLANGDDVLNYKLIQAISDIAGITEIEILQGTSDPPTLSNNTTVAATQLAVIETANIDVNS
jgi:uncharacterized phage protein gp47/JayE